MEATLEKHLQGSLFDHSRRVSGKKNPKGKFLEEFLKKFLKKGMKHLNKYLELSLEEYWLKSFKDFFLVTNIAKSRKNSWINS